MGSVNLTALSHILLYRNHFVPDNDPNLRDKKMHVWIRDNTIMNIFSKEKEDAIKKRYKTFPYTTFRQFWEHNIKMPNHQDRLEWIELQENPYAHQHLKEGTYLMLMYLWHEVKENPWTAKPICLKIGESQNMFKRVAGINSSRSYGLFGIMIGRRWIPHSNKRKRLNAENELRDKLINDFEGTFYEGSDYITIPNIENYTYKEVMTLVQSLEM